jgi:hypothetical protein
MAKRKESNAKVEETQERPEYLSPEWNDYVMGLFQPNELIDGNPNVAGLRRVAELLIGEIVSSKPTQVFPVLSEGIGRATVVYEIVFDVNGSGKTKTYGDTAELWAGNTDDLFCVHAAATASTKAEARSLRKALKIRAVAAEELCKKDVSKYVAEEDNNRITSDQINFIGLKCKKLDIDVMLFVNSGAKQYKSIYEVTRDTAAKMIKRIHTFSSDNSLIDDNIKNYKEDWNENAS